MKGYQCSLLIIFVIPGSVATDSSAAPRVVDRGEQRGLLERLGEKDKGARGCATFPHTCLIVGGNDDGWNVDPIAREMEVKFQAIHFRHLQVDDQAFGPPVGQCREKFPRRSKR